MSYFILFLSAFAAATLLPFYSELALVALLSEEKIIWLLWVSATSGNTLGAAVNWWLGLRFVHFEHKKWFPIKRKNLERSQRWFQKWGVWSLLLTWLPVGGDALTLLAGIMKVRFWVFFTLTLIGKGFRYALVIMAYFSVEAVTFG